MNTGHFGLGYPWQTLIFQGYFCLPAGVPAPICFYPKFAQQV